MELKRNVARFVQRDVARAGRWEGCGKEIEMWE